MTNDHRYWFAATPFGYGWWRPSHAFGWLTVLAAVTAVFLAGWWFPPATSAPSFWATIAGVVTVFLLICRLKGEPLARARR